MQHILLAFVSLLSGTALAADCTVQSAENPFAQQAWDIRAAACGSNNNDCETQWAFTGDRSNCTLNMPLGGGWEVDLFMSDPSGTYPTCFAAFANILEDCYTHGDFDPSMTSTSGTFNFNSEKYTLSISQFQNESSVVYEFGLDGNDTALDVAVPTPSLQAPDDTNSAGTNLHADGGCILVATPNGFSPICQGGSPYNVPDQGVPESTVLIFACIPSDTTDAQVTPGCRLDAVWPRGFGDVFMNTTNCLVDSGENSIDYQCASALDPSQPTQVPNPYLQTAQATTVSPPLATNGPTDCCPAECFAGLCSIPGVDKSQCSCCDFPC